MNELDNLAYFLNSIKETLPFKDENDFAKKIKKSKEFRIKVQKLVYLSKYFGWNNSYHFNFHERGPYSLQLSEDYHNISSFDKENKSFKINEEFNEFLLKDNEYLESITSLLYYANALDLSKISKEDAITNLRIIKPHISRKTISKSYDTIKKFNLFNCKIEKSKFNNINSYEKIVMDKSKGMIHIFENYEISSNRLFLLGTLDYFRLVFENGGNENLELLNRLYDYAEKVEKEYFKYHPKNVELKDMNLSMLKDEFNDLQNYVSENLKIIPKLDENTDLSFFF